jgi:hypothetical protein
MFAPSFVQVHAEARLQGTYGVSTAEPVRVAHTIVGIYARFCAASEPLNDVFTLELFSEKTKLDDFPERVLPTSLCTSLRRFHLEGWIADTER